MHRSHSVDTNSCTGMSHGHYPKQILVLSFNLRYEALIWIPSVITFIVMLGVGGKNLVNAPLSGTVPVTADNIMTFGATLAATVVSWSTITPDYGVYHDHKAST